MRPFTKVGVMEIDELDDFSATYHTPFDFVPHSWNGHDVRWIADLGIGLHEKIGQFHRTSNSSLVKRAEARSVDPLYLGQKQTPKATVAPCSNVITSPISLSQLLSPDYLDQEILQIPFTLPADLACLPSFFELPEGISLEIFNSELLATFSPPTFDPLFFEYYQGSLLAEYNETIAPVAELAQLAMVVIAQAQVFSNVVQQSVAIVTAEELARTDAVAAAKAKTNTAKIEGEKAIGAFLKVQDAAKPPLIPPRGFATEPLQVTYDRWLANKTNAAIAAAEHIRLLLMHWSRLRALLHSQLCKLRL